MIKIKHLKAFEDNYIWLIINGNEVVAIDPGQSAQVINYITNNNLQLKSILLTHGHNDHVGGVHDILNFGYVDVYGHKMNKYATKFVHENDNFEILPGVWVKVIETAGHTYDGVSYLINDSHLFCGDTLFFAGCGRVFTKDYNLMYNSLLKIKTLRPEVLIYPAHEYTLANLYFAKALNPDNTSIDKCLKEIIKKRQLDQITLPTTIGMQLKINPFFMCDNLEHFIEIRNLKDNFN